jgi:hypothetical protein
MTLIGKFFVLINVAISVMMLAVGVGLYMTRSDWTETAPKGNAPPGLIYTRKKALDAAKEKVDPARLTLSRYTAGLNVANKMRFAAQAQYGKHLDAVLHVSKDVPPILPSEVDTKGGLPVVNADGTLTMVAAKEREGGPLYSIEFYTTKLEGVTGLWNQYIEKRKEFDKVTQEDIDEASKLAVSWMGRKKGLLEIITEEQLKEEGLRDEILTIAPPLELKSGSKLAVSPKQVEAAILEARLKRLDKQVADLEKTLERLKKLDGAAP